MQSQPDVLLKAVYLLSYYYWHFSRFLHLQLPVSETILSDKQSYFVYRLPLRFVDAYAVCGSERKLYSCKTKWQS